MIQSSSRLSGLVYFLYHACSTSVLREGKPLPRDRQSPPISEIDQRILRVCRSIRGLPRAKPGRRGGGGGSSPPQSSAWCSTVGSTTIFFVDGALSNPAFMVIFFFLFSLARQRLAQVLPRFTKVSLKIAKANQSRPPKGE